MAVILVVDDEKANRALLRAHLTAAQHEVVEACDGEEALSRVAAHTPDLVLLDVVMPGLDGFEVTRRLRATSEPKFLPVVLVTALTDQSSRRLGLAAGADEFLTKPIDAQELLLRVRNLLALRQKGAECMARNVELAELQRFKDEMTSLLVHDLKNPLAALIGNLDYALDDPALEGDARDAIVDSRMCTRRLKELIGNLIDTQRLEAARLTLRRAPIDSSAWIAPVVASRRFDAARRGVVIETKLDAGCTVDLDVGLSTRAIENLLDNAVRHTPKGGRIGVEVRGTDTHVDLAVGNTGGGIPEELRAHLFEKYSQGDATGRTSLNLGLGLYFCRLVVEAQGGRIGVEPTPDFPARFVIRMPRGELAR